MPGRLKVLIVDDELRARDSLLEYFSQPRFRGVAASDGRQALALLHASHGCFGLVVTDLSLPGADGFAVLQAARHANPRLRRHRDGVCVARLSDPSRAVGAYDDLTKPFSSASSMSSSRAFTTESNSGSRVADYSSDRVPITPGEHASDDVEQRLAAIEASLTRIEHTLERRAFRRAPTSTVGVADSAMCCTFATQPRTGVRAVLRAPALLHGGRTHREQHL